MLLFEVEELGLLLIEPLAETLDHLSFKLVLTRVVLYDLHELCRGMRALGPAGCVQG
jgi:hypothetical protein